ncbi:MAG: Phosphonate transporter, permease protein PhnE [Dehalococcoidia bacterium]|nr:Phosphonate transporter, permease protein PhnE [Dehalococcoidia bacterium]
MIRAFSGFKGLFILLTAAWLLSLGNVGLLDPLRLGRGAVNIGSFVTSLFPPNTAVIPTVALAMVETVEIAFAGTILGFL